jgi:DNA primase
MLSKKTIDEVKALSLELVISKIVTLTKTGSTLKGKSPFTDEKSGSFMISPSKNIWKCFSTGFGGNNAISFIMQAKKISFIDAVKELAQDNGIPIEYDDSDRAKDYQKKQEKIQKLSDINSIATSIWAKNIDLVEKEFQRSTPEMNEKFNIGFALNDFNALKNELVNVGYTTEQLFDAGLVGKNAKNNHFDSFRGRVMFPIYDVAGKILGFTGRLAIHDPEKKAEKVKNTKETDAFKKANSLLGLFQSKSDIIRLDEVIIVEGNYHLTSMHQTGFVNTVCSMGTAFTEEHADLILKFTKTITFFVDNDKAGKEKIEKNTILCLSKGMGVSIFLSEIEGEDADDWSKRLEFNQEETHKLFKEGKKDAILYLAELYFENATTPIQINDAEKKLSFLLSNMADGALRGKYIKLFAKTHNIDKAQVESLVKSEIATRKTEETPEGKGVFVPAHLTSDEAEDFKEFGFYPERSKEKIGYYFQGQYGTERVSNWLMRPLFHVLDMKGSKRFIELVHSRGTIVVEIPNAKLNNPQAFEDVVSDRGNFYFFATKKQYQRLKSKFLTEFPTCTEIKTLGWYFDGFFSFANGIVEGGVFKKVDQYGVVNHGEKQYFLPAFSSVYKDNKADDDLYESDRKFQYKSGGIGFTKWSKKFNEVYKENSNGIFGISFLVASIFSDYIFSEKEFFPILMMYGQPQTGKTTCGRSISRVFKANSSAFNLHSGTVTGFQRVLSRSRNIIEHLDEYRNDLDEKRFQALKGIWDRTGSIKGQMSNDNRTIETKINSCALVTGQHFPTRDGNSLYSRIIALDFTKKQENFTNKEIKTYNELIEMEALGLSDVIVEIIRYRSKIEKDYVNTEFEIGSKIRDEFISAGEFTEGRVVGNFVVLLTVVKILEDCIQFPFTYEDLYEKSKQFIISQSKLIEESNELGEFFDILVFLALTHQVINGEDYKFEPSRYDIKIRAGKEEKTVQFEKRKNILYLKMAKIHPLYVDTSNKQKKTPLDKATIFSYMENHKAFLGKVKTVRFSDSSTSAFAFDYDMLGITLSGCTEEEANQPTSQHKTHYTKAINNAAQSELPLEKKDKDLPF